ncbi:hypothetical protein PESP_a2870 [Pseudoalteromonas espejiana DSM 9414]|nr:hypothetical protein PESP_a2870 [Pseudoalteromonas espejiana DSM 9414]
MKGLSYDKNSGIGIKKAAKMQPNKVSENLFNLSNLQYTLLDC